MLLHTTETEYGVFAIDTEIVGFSVNKNINRNQYISLQLLATTKRSQTELFLLLLQMYWTLGRETTRFWLHNNYIEYLLLVLKLVSAFVSVVCDNFNMNKNVRRDQYFTAQHGRIEKIKLFFWNAISLPRLASHLHLCILAGECKYPRRT